MFLVSQYDGGYTFTLAIQANMNDLARYALICQSEGLMPIVEPGISLKGTHTLEEAVEVNIKVQSALFQALREHNVYLPGCTMKSNMANPGIDCVTAYSVYEIAAANIFVLQQSFPVSMKGTHFLSGGQTFGQAAARLTAMNELKARASEKNDNPNSDDKKYECPWNLSFSWSAAIQLPLLDLCKGRDGVLPLNEMSEMYIDRLRIAALAATGKWHQNLNKNDGNHCGK